MDGAFCKRKFRVRLKHKQRMERDGESRAEMPLTRNTETVRGESRRSTKAGVRIGEIKSASRVWISETPEGSLIMI
jgi:hypothetical protein